ncbi:MAG TPA: hypothetical protein VH985_08750 [Candidatus Binatia bacterium]
MQRRFIVVLSALFGAALLSTTAYAHGVIGKRFIPSTLTLEDPFPSDEMDLLSFERGSKNKEGRETSVGFEFSKRLTPDFALGVGWEYLFVEPREADVRRTSGAANPEFSAKYSFFRSIEHEAIFSAGLAVEAGGVGSKRVAERVTTISPALFFGKGWGDLPDSLSFLKPFALTGSFSVDNPANRFTGSGDDKERNVTTLSYGAALIYSVPYLQSAIKDIGLSAPFDRMFPLVEFNFESPVSGPDKRHTTAFANPGVIWAGKYVQLGLEAQVPMNDISGKNVGIKGLIHVFIDDIWPNIFTWTPWGTIGPTSR